jgi:hypothetical protein
MQTNHQNITFLNIAVDWKTNPRISVVSVEQLRSLLASLSSKESGFVELESSKKDRLQLGVGGKFACAQFTTHNDKPRYLSAKPQTVHATSDIEFLCGGTPTPIPPEMILLFDEAVRIAEYFFLTGERDPNIEWMEA